MLHTTSYIDHSIETPSGLPQNIQTFLKQLDSYDKQGEWCLYFDRLDDLWVNSKNAIAANVMTNKDWKILEQKYWIHADEVYDEEMSNENI